MIILVKPHQEDDAGKSRMIILKPRIILVGFDKKGSCVEAAWLPRPKPNRTKQDSTRMVSPRRPFSKSGQNDPRMIDANGGMAWPPRLS